MWTNNYLVFRTTFHCKIRMMITVKENSIIKITNLSRIPHKAWTGISVYALSCEHRLNTCNWVRKYLVWFGHVTWHTQNWAQMYSVAVKPNCEISFKWCTSPKIFFVFFFYESSRKVALPPYFKRNQDIDNLRFLFFLIVHGFLMSFGNANLTVPCTK